MTWNLSATSCCTSCEECFPGRVCVLKPRRISTTSFWSTKWRRHSIGFVRGTRRNSFCILITATPWGLLIRLTMNTWEGCLLSSCSERYVWSDWKNGWYFCHSIFCPYFDIMGRILRMMECMIGWLHLPHMRFPLFLATVLCMERNCDLICWQVLLENGEKVWH